MITYNTRYEDDNIAPGMSLNYTCNEGYYIDNETDLITCLEARPGNPAHWSAVVPTCKRESYIVIYIR